MKAPDSMKRRALLVASGAWFISAASRSHAQTARRIAYLHPGSQDLSRDYLGVFRARLKELGYVEGRDISIETYWAGGNYEKLASLAVDAVARNPALILTVSSAGVAALKKATPRIPIVFATAANPVEQGFVSSLRRPGGNITGITLHQDLEAKTVEIVREALPAARRLGVLIHEPDPIHKLMLKSYEPAAKQFGFELVVVRLARVEDLERAFKDFAAHKADAVLAPALTFLATNRKRIIELARGARLPLFSSLHQMTEDGGFLTYGTQQEENFRRAAGMADRILRGAKPGDLAVEQPERFEMVINLNTAKAIDVRLPHLFLLRATKVIE